MANEIFIYDEIGPEWYGMVDSKSIIRQLDAFRGQPVTVRINSPGGSVTEGQAIYNALKRHDGDVTIAVDAIAASSASVIAMAGKRIEMAANSLMMIHNAWTITIGDKAEHEKVIGILDKFGGAIRDRYAERTGLSGDEIQSMLDAETWMTAEEAVAKKFADAVTGSNDVAACAIKEGRYLKTPAMALAAQLPREQARKRREQDASLRLRLTRARFGR